ncbi:MAG: ABC transporter ATP-binding protein [Lachnospiraceae bacterium]|nr:ABC transporter ATP-binding protein [Lachnospiraceae bacterium]
MTVKKDILISVKNLKKEFRTGETSQTIFENLTLTVYKGDFTVIMGASRAGKSTLMYSLSGMDRPTEGSILFSDKEITKYNDDELAVFRRKKCGFVFQQIYLLDKMSLMDNVLTAGALCNNNKKEVIQRVKELFELVNIPDITQKKFSTQVFGGEAQRAGIVRAVINNPAVIFADEPTGALNSNNPEAALNVFTKLHREGQSIIMVTHDKKTALRGNSILYIKDGRIFGDCCLENYSEADKEREKQYWYHLQARCFIMFC